MSLLQLNNVSYTYKNRYQSVDAVKSVSAEFERGNFYVIIGRSGSGKTTLLSLMAGLDLPTSGEVVFDNRTTYRMNRDKYRREDVTVIYQHFNLFPLLTVLENVMYPMELRGMKTSEAKKRAAQMIAEVGLPETTHKRYPSMLSGGEQQRVAIARALASGSRVILADEPTGNLDTENGNNIIEILQRLAHEQGYCVIVVTHDMEIAKRADHLITMHDGEATHS